MKTEYSLNLKFDKLYVTAHVICLVAFFMPASRLTIDGHVFSQYLLTSYPGWVALSLIVSFFVVIQGLYYYKRKRWLPWLGLITGIYALGFAVTLIAQSLFAFKTVEPYNLATKLHAAASVQAGLWLLAVGGGMLFVVALLKIMKKRSAIVPVTNV